MRTLRYLLPFLLLPWLAIAQQGTPSFGTVTTSGGLFGPTGAATVTTPGGATARPLGQIANDTINPLFYGPGGAAVDITGTSDAAPAILAAVTAACATTPAKGVLVPPGVYGFASVVSVPCSDVSISPAVPGSVTFRILPANTSNPAIMLFNGVDRPRVHGIKFDGTGATNSNGALQVSGPSISPELDSNVFTNMVGNGVWIVGGPPIIAGFLSADVAQGDTTMTLATIDSRVHKGAYFLNEIDPDIYVSAEPVGTTITMNKAITNSMLKNTRINVTPAFTVTADVFQGTVLPVAHTDGLAVKQTVYSPSAPCVTRGTRIASFIANTSVTLEKPITCKVASGTSFAAQVGVSKLRVTNNRFEELGMALAGGNPVVYTTATLTSTGTNTMTLACVSGVKCAQVGLIPYNTTGTTGLPTGVPALNPVVDQTAINSSAGTYTVRFANNFTANIPAGTQVPFLGPQSSGKGYALWSGYGAWFANLDYELTDNLVKHTWSSPFFVWHTSGTMIARNKLILDGQEFANPTIFPSACLAVSIGVNVIIDGNDCVGPTGTGFETNHNNNISFTNNHVDGTGTVGIFNCGGGGSLFSNNIVTNSGQWVNRPITQQFSDDHSSAISVSGSCTFARVGVQSNVLFGPNTLGDNQQVATQNYGVWQANHNAILNNVSFNTSILNTFGNKIRPFDPVLGFDAPPLGADNRIINPCMTIDQSNEGALLLPPGSAYGPDQWQVLSSPARVNYQRVATAMGGCPNSLKMTVAVSATPGAAEFSYAQQFIEAAFLGDLKAGTAFAKNLIVDFCASASTAGTYGWGLQNHFASHLRAYASAFTIAAPNTPQCYSFSVAGDTVAGFSGVPGAAGLGINFDTGSGSNYVTGTCNAWADITSNHGFFCNTGTALVTLAIGQSINVSAVRIYPAAVDSSWVQNTDAVEQAAAARYFEKTFLAIKPAQNAGLIGALCSQNPTGGAPMNVQWNFSVPMRQAPAIITFNPSAANANWRDTTAAADVAVTVDPDGSADPLQVLIQAAATPLNDISCIHATASARY